MSIHFYAKKIEKLNKTTRDTNSLKPPSNKSISVYIHANRSAHFFFISLKPQSHKRYISNANQSKPYSSFISWLLSRGDAHNVIDNIGILQNLKMFGFFELQVIEGPLAALPLHTRLQTVHVHCTVTVAVGYLKYVLKIILNANITHSPARNAFEIINIFVIVEYLS